MREAARITPADRILVETDSPFLTPEPHRGQPNEPALVSAVGAALALARAGEFDRAGKVAGELERQYPEDSVLNAVSLPAIRATIELQRGRPDRAMELLRSLAPYELGFTAGVGPTFIRGEALLRMRMIAKAAAEFERVIARPGVEAVSPLHSLAWLELARASALAGNQPRSREAYQKFFALWKNADANLPVLKQARAEFPR